MNTARNNALEEYRKNLAYMNISGSLLLLLFNALLVFTPSSPMALTVQVLMLMLFLASLLFTVRINKAALELKQQNKGQVVLSDYAAKAYGFKAMVVTAAVFVSLSGVSKVLLGDNPLAHLSVLLVTSIILAVGLITYAIGLLRTEKDNRSQHQTSSVASS